MKYDDTWHILKMERSSDKEKNKRNYSA